MASPQVSTRHYPVIRVFVSSTFSDLKHERNALQREVFPRLEAYCQRYGFQFQAIDLRWGVPSEAGLDHRTMRICFDELRRSQEVSPRPNFLILLGDRYGWRPLPEEISTAEFEQLARAAAAEPASFQILEQWYRRDDNAVPPVHVLRSRRDSPDGRNYGRTDDGQHDQPAWQEVQAVLWSVINKAFPPTDLASRFRSPNLADHPIPSIVRFQASATEQEIWNGALRVPDADQHVFAFVRRIENIKECLAEARPDTGLRDFLDLQADDRRDVVAEVAQQQLLAELQRLLTPQNASPRPNFREITATARLKFDAAAKRFDVSTDHVQSLCDAVCDQLLEVVKRQIDEYWRVSQPDSDLTADQTAPATQTIPRIERELELEVEAHDRFGAERAQANTFVGRAAETQRILDYLRGTDRRPLVVYGPSGTGKTALLAYAALRAEQELGCKPIVRYLGTTPHSGTVRSLLTSLCRQLRRKFEVKGEPPTEFRELADDFAKLLADHSSQPIFIFLDALDQLDDLDNGRQLHWLRYSQNQPLAENVKLVVSCLSDMPDEDPSGQPLHVLEQRQLTTGCVAINELTREEASTLLFDRWLCTEGGLNITPSPDGRPKRTIASGHQRDYLEKCIRQATEHTECRRPLYLKILYEEARLWRSFDSAPIAIPETSADLLRGLFRRLRQPHQHGPLVNWAIGYLAASRYGLAEIELLEILFADPDYLKILDLTNKRLGHELPSGAKRIPIALWARLRYDLQPYLAERAAVGGQVLAFYHRQVAEWIRRRFTRFITPHRVRHLRLARYFQTCGDPDRDRTWTGKSARALSELPYHQIHSSVPQSVFDTLTDLSFVAAKCKADMVFPLQADYAMAIAAGISTVRDDSFDFPPPKPISQWVYECESMCHDVLNRLDPESAKSSYGDLFNMDYSIDPHPDRGAGPVIRTLTNRSSISDSLFGPDVGAGAMIADLKASQSESAGQDEARNDSTDAFGAFAQFVISHSHIFAAAPGEVVVAAYNSADSGPIVEQAGRLLAKRKTPWLMRTTRPPFTRIRPACLRVIEAHSDEIWQVVLNRDGRTAFSTGFDGLIRHWNTTTGELLQTIDTKQGTSTARNWDLAVTEDGQTVICPTAHGTIQRWDFQTGSQTAELRGNLCEVTGVAASITGKIVLSVADHGRVWTSDGTTRRLLKTKESTLSAVRMTLDGRIAATASSGGFIDLWDIVKGDRLATLSASGGVMSLAFAADGRLLASASDDKTVQIWDVAQARCLRVLSGHGGCVSCVAMTPDGRLAVSGGDDNMVRIWDVAAGEMLGVLPGHTRQVSAIAISDNGRIIASASKDNTVRIWDARRALSSKTAAHKWTDFTSAVAIQPLQQRVASVHWNGRLNIWNASSESIERSIETDRSEMVHALAIDPAFTLALTAGSEGSVRLWHLEAGVCLRCLDGFHNVPSRGLAFSKDGKMALVAGDSGHLKVFDLTIGRCCNESAVLSSWQMLKHQSVVTQQRLGQVSIGSHRYFIEKVPQLLSGFCLGSDGRSLLLAVMDNGKLVIADAANSKIWNWGFGTAHSSIEHRDGVCSLAVFPDGSRAITGSMGDLISWNISSDTAVRHEASGGLYSGISVYPDGSGFATTNHDKWVRCYDSDAKLQAQYYAGAFLTSISNVSPTGRFAYGTEDGQVHVLQLQGHTFGTPHTSVNRRWNWQLAATDLRTFQPGEILPGGWEDGDRTDCPWCGYSLLLESPKANAVTCPKCSKPCRPVGAQVVDLGRMIADSTARWEATESRLIAGLLGVVGVAVGLLWDTTAGFGLAILAAFVFSDTLIRKSTPHVCSRCQNTFLTKRQHAAPILCPWCKEP